MVHKWVGGVKFNEVVLGGCDQVGVNHLISYILRNNNDSFVSNYVLENHKM